MKETIPITVDTLERALRALMTGYQQVRSIHKETFEDMSSEFVEGLFPWTCGPKCSLPAIIKLLEVRERWNIHHTPSGIHNLLYVAYKLTPEVVFHCHTAASLLGMPSPLWSELPDIRDVIAAFGEDEGAR